VTKVLEDRREDVAAAMQGLCDAVGKLSMVRDELVAGLKDAAPGHPDEALALGLQRTCETLTQAAGCVPHELWYILIQGNSVGGEELRHRVNRMIQNTMIMDGCARSRLAVPA